MQPNEAAAEFKKLIDKSQQKFALLRELPPYGRRHWEEHFHKVRPQGTLVCLMARLMPYV